ncbi:hypothetical protein CALCODRAFT_432835 [Calocera cornea HHB12733]|uniref:Methyltransferase domain-containing protein n=1 Tax=Calocera cornea HHB12733 TaxID=1353952 RepID=A0A165GP06_9BASI|nr:hypothetical protein CALCODRAFT_432835 [Calocera cornea HHB12733]
MAPSTASIALASTTALAAVLYAYTPLGDHFEARFLLPIPLIVLLLSFTRFKSTLRTVWLFCYNCFLRPLGLHSDQQSRLDSFYTGQAEVYDATRNGLLRGRRTLLRLSMAHLKVLRAQAADQNKRLVWVDIGGGTGWNIEHMSQYVDLKMFDAIYLIDLCEPLLNVARKRFEKNGWTNVHCLLQDASGFVLPEWKQLRIDPRGSVSFVTLSYSLSMIPSYFTLLDRIEHVLDPDDGLLGVCDFYTAAKESSEHEKAIGGGGKKVGWFSRWFWQIWFDFDHVSLSPGRRDYLEYRFGTIKSYNGRNKFIVPFIVRIPYYIWLGTPRTRSTERNRHAFEIEGGNTVGNLSAPGTPLAPTRPTTPLSLIGKEAGDGDEMEVEELSLGLSRAVSQDELHSVLGERKEGEKEGRKNIVLDVMPPLSSFHYQIMHPWRLPYYEAKVHKAFRTFVYSFTWEDPDEDMRHLQLSKEDSMFVITSAGDNALHYAIAAGPKRIHCVDMNPCQGHLMELKLAAIQSLDFGDFFKLFGDGKHPEFRQLLDCFISPYLSNHAYTFWRINSKAYHSSFYRRGYSGWALRLAKWVFSFAGVSDFVDQICECDTVEEQDKIWREKIRPVILNKAFVDLVLSNPVFCWNALGVPMNQRAMFLNEGTAFEFVRDTLDPIAKTAVFKHGAYHFLLCLLGHYTADSCPLYLTREGFAALKANDGARMDAFRLHTDSITNVLRGLAPGSITRAVIMDHLDWFDPGSEDARDEILAMYRALAPGGMVFWRSAARLPWYCEMFKEQGFELQPLGVRTGPEKAIDRVNMYASFWRAVKV